MEQAHNHDTILHRIATLETFTTEMLEASVISWLEVAGVATAVV